MPVELVAVPEEVSAQYVNPLDVPGRVRVSGDERAVLEAALGGAESWEGIKVVSVSDLVQRSGLSEERVREALRTLLWERLVTLGEESGTYWSANLEKATAALQSGPPPARRRPSGLV